MPATIPPATLEKFSNFGDLLRFLRRRIGITQLELAAAVGYSDTQISRLEQNLRLPDLPTIEARFISALDLEDEPNAVTRLLDLAANVRREDAPGLGLCPYKGLNYFDEADADLFVGREELTARLTERVLSLAANSTQDEPRFLAIVGASGSGKSSLVRAGLVSALRWNKISTNWHIHVLTPTAHPLENLAAVLTDSVSSTTTLMDDLARDERSLQIFIKRQLRASNSTHIILVIDQFEELFALCRSEEERVSFIGNLLSAASERDGPLVIVITLRADFYAPCANYPPLRKSLARSQEYIGAMNNEELRRAIEEPARRGRWELENGLVNLLLHEVGHEPGALPLLSHALYETWQRRRGRVMTLSGYTSSGGVRGAIAETAETLFSDQFNHEQRAIARRIFLRLTELGDETGAGDTRRRATFNELILHPEESTTTHAVLKALADARLITTTENAAEVSHEALIREWPTLHGWLEENREGLRLHRQLTEASQEWLTMKREPDMLFRGARLAQTREWVSTHQDELNELEREFLDASIAFSEREIQEREAQRQQALDSARRLADSERQRAEVERQRAEEQVRYAGQLRKRAVYLTGAFGVALIMAVAAVFFGRQALIESWVSTSRELALASISNLDVDPERSILLALEALDNSYTVEAEDALHRAVQASRVKKVLQVHEPGPPVGVAYSPDGTKIVTSSFDELVKVWDATTSERLFTVDGHCATYSPDGKQIASVVNDYTVKLWDALTGEEIPMPNQIDATICVNFSPDGSRLVTGSSDGTVRIWDVKSGKELVTFKGHSTYVPFAMFSPDGRRVLSVSADSPAIVWDARTGEELFPLSGNQGWVWTGTFSPDGKYIATATENEIFLWDAETGERLSVIAHSAFIDGILFNAGSSWLVTTSTDRKIKVWDVATGRELFALVGHTGDVVGLDFSPDEKHLVTGSTDGTIRIWDITLSRELLTISAKDASGQLAFSIDDLGLVITDHAEGIRVWDAFSGDELMVIPDLDDRIGDLAISPDGKYVFKAGEDASVNIWDTTTGNKLGNISGHTGPVTDIAISRDGKLLGTASTDYKVMIWSISSGKVGESPLLILEHIVPVNAISFSADGSKLAAGDEQGTIRVWDMANGKEVQALRGHKDLVTDVVFSPDGTRIATSSFDGTAKVWNISTGQELFTLHGHTGEVMSIAYSPAEERIATVGNDGAAKLWDAVTGSELLTFFGDGSDLREVAFSPDGKLLATSGVNGVRVYLSQIEDLIALAKTRVTRSLTSEECQEYLHLEPSACDTGVAVPTTTPFPPTDQGRVCQVTNTEGLYDNSFNEMIYKGLQDSNNAFGWDVKVLQSVSTSDFEKNLSELQRGDCDLIVGVFQIADVMEVAAKANPNQKFLIEFMYEQPPDNLWMQSYAIDQAAFLAGYAAASVTKTGKVATFGGVDIPGVTVFMDGFALGVTYYNQKNGTNIELLGWDAEKHEGLFVGDFCCALEGRQITQQLLADGADVILPAAGAGVAPGAAYAIRTHGNAYVIGVDTDWAVTNPEYGEIVLTSIVKNLDVSVVRAVRAIEDDTFSGGEHIGTLETGEVGLAPFYQFDSLISDEVKAELEKIKAEIIAGTIRTKP